MNIWLLIVETGDFNRFINAEKYSAYLGLVPREHSSGENTNRFGITKAGNSHLRTLLVEAAQSDVTKRNVAVTAIARELSCM